MLELFGIKEYQRTRSEATKDVLGRIIIAFAFVFGFIITALATIAMFAGYKIAFFILLPALVLTVISLQILAQI